LTELHQRASFLYDFCKKRGISCPTERSQFLSKYLRRGVAQATSELYLIHCYWIFTFQSTS